MLRLRLCDDSMISLRSGSFLDLHCEINCAAFNKRIIPLTLPSTFSALVRPAGHDTSKNLYGRIYPLGGVWTRRSRSTPVARDFSRNVGAGEHLHVAKTRRVPHCVGHKRVG